MKQYKMYKQVYVHSIRPNIEYIYTKYITIKKLLFAISYMIDLLSY